MRIVIIPQLIGCGSSLAAAPNTPNIPDGASPVLVMLGYLDAHRRRKEEIVQVSPAYRCAAPDHRNVCDEESANPTSSTSAPTSAPPSRLCLSRRPTPMANPQTMPSCRGGRENTTPLPPLTSFVAADG